MHGPSSQGQECLPDTWWVEYRTKNHRRPTTLRRGQDSHGKSTRAKHAQNAAASAKLNYLRDLGNLLGMFTGKTGWPGRKLTIYLPPAKPDPLELVRLIEELDSSTRGSEPTCQMSIPAHTPKIAGSAPAAGLGR